ncbi:MAG: amidohydrolase [Bacteroidales bacterium]|nr:amidohydrolase [Bacteroidales bacterium]
MKGIILKNIELDGSKVDIYISDGLFKHILPTGSIPPEDFPKEEAETIFCTHKSACPSFANMHTHSEMNLMRGAGEDMALEKWLDAIWLIEESLSSDYIYWSGKLACAEMIKTGTTLYNNHYWYVPTAHRSAHEMGVRHAMGYVLLDRMDPELTKVQKEQFLKTFERAKPWNREMAQFLVCFHSIYTVSEEMLLWGADFARKNGLRIHMHLSETETEVANCIKAHGVTPVKYLSQLGLLGKDLIAAHALHLTEEDVELLGKNKVTCVHNINSNLKIGSGYKFLYKELKAAGANICLGTDGCASSNNLDMLETMKTSAMLQKAFRGDPTAMPLNELLDTATINAAEALGFNTGKIEEGRSADMLIVDTNSCFFLSNAPFIANFVYSAHSDSITDVLCAGRFLMRNKEIPGEEEILAQSRRVLSSLKL